MSQIIKPRIATLLGNFGLLPFFAPAAASWVPFGAPYERFVEQALVGDAAVTLSFLGAVHWGLALATPALDKAQAWNAFGWGIAPSALAWIALLLAIAGVVSRAAYAADDRRDDRARFNPVTEGWTCSKRST